MNSLFLGLITVIIAALFQGSFAVPMAYSRNWKWENSWMIFSIFGMIVFNLLFAIMSVPALFLVYRTLPINELLFTITWGVIWGFGAIAFGLGITSTGLALGYAIILGTVLSMGTFIPMVVLHPADIVSTRGILILVGLIVTLWGIGTSGYAGIKKEREQGKTAGEITKTARFSTKAGILICFAAGLCSSAINIGFSLSKSLVDTALSLGSSELWAGNAIWFVMFSSGGFLNIFYCLYLMGVNKTAHWYNAQGSLKNFGLLLLMSVLWIGSFILYGVGATMMGAWGTVIGWSVYMALSIAIANLWGIIQGEWRGTSPVTKLLMARGLVIILCAIIIFAVSGII